MTTVKRLEQAGEWIGVEVKGHTGYARAGKDIVCAAISAVVQTAYLGIKSLTALELDVTTNEGYFRMAIVGGSASEKEKANLILNTMMLGLKDIQSGYPRYIRLED